MKNKGMRPFGWKGETSNGDEILFSTEDEMKEYEEEEGEEDDCESSQIKK